ncbi:MAG: hypothetical protein KBC91_03075 [Candidatus Omnitrophica bacterium]|nr:hypothetical protein [Candidatus Omnitrophota bacterium]
MRKVRKVCAFFLAVSLCVAAPSAGRAADEEEEPKVPTGILELEGYKYPVLLLVPETYTRKVAYPLIVTVPAEGQEPKDALAYWEGMSRRRNMIVLAPSGLRPDGLPTAVDEWILGIMKDVAMRYRISPKRIYLFGKDDGAHYAAYLGTRHPEAFSAVALVSGSWIGKYEKIIWPASNAAEQRPFIIYLREDQQELYQATMKKALEFENKGYSVQVKTVVGEDHLARIDFKKQLFEVIETKNQEWQDVIAESGKTFKQRARLAVKEFFAV